MNAVITADVIDSTKLSREGEDLVIKTIYDTFSKDSTIRTNVDESYFLITRGDSIQLELDDASKALTTALLLKTALNKITLLSNRKPSIDVRIAIGLGEITGKRNNVNESTGGAYTNSGRTLDSMKKYKRKFAVKTDNTNLDTELETEFKLLEVIMSGWVVTSAEVLYWTLIGLNENEISEKIGITQSAINQRKKTAGWSGIEALLNRFEVLVSKEVAL
ncbi:hypothetical protein [Saccharicrinis aurantiacus]|uniref:hypothetical protein n=1 Tax=Saccharicrinis aurantiacus TaxID=1849719 RepID=UPI00094FA7A7|nr:hypothetical protein [Saccharicrinis aurantiacus]